MRIYSQGVKDIALWIVFILYLFALAYIGDGGQSLLILLFVIAFSALVAVGILQSLSESLEEYYCEKRRKREYEKHYSEITSPPKY